MVCCVEVRRSKQHVLVVDSTFASSERLQLIVRVPVGECGRHEHRPWSHGLAAAQGHGGRRRGREGVVGARQLWRKRLVFRP